MSATLIPRPDATFSLWQSNLVTKTMASSTQWGIPQSILTEVTTRQSRWTSAFSAAENPATRTKAAVKKKQDARDDYEQTLRELIRAYLTYNPAITDADRENLGLPVHDTKPTPAPPITVRPEVEVEFAEVQQHTLIVRDPVSKSAGKPAHAAGFEIWRKVGGEAPAADADWQLVTQAPHSPHTLSYNQSESGLRVYYRVRWVNTRGVPGPWSETVNAIIA